MASASASRDMSAVGTELPVLDAVRNPLARDVPDVALALQQLVDLGLVDVESHRAETGVHERLHQRQAHVAEPDDANHGGLVLNGQQQGMFGLYSSSHADPL